MVNKENIQGVERERGAGEERQQSKKVKHNKYLNTKL